MNEDLFYKCSEINDYLIDGDEPKARDLLIQLLDYVGRNNIQYFPLLNSLIREVGLYPYMDVNSSEWEDAFVYNLFKADIGLNEEKVLHREQFRLLSSLLAGKNIAVSAPTSFGKSFVIDAFIKLRKPRNVAIIVPTIALTDETRRRIYKKFAYKNLIGRAGRMFKHFIGNIYVLAKRPNDTETQLAIPFPEEILGDLDKEKYEKILTREQVAKIDEHDKEMLNLVGNAYKEYKNDSILQAQDSNLLKTIAHKLSSNPEAWECLKYLNYSNPDYWDAALYKILNLQPGAWDAKYGTFVEFVKILSGNWEKTIPELLQDLDDIGIGLDTFFRLERNVSFKLSSLISDVNILQKAILKSDFDLSPFISKLSSVFLPTVVYQLEEYGLPRMIAKKIQNSGLIDFEDKGLTLSAAISKFNTLNDEDIISCSKLESFEIYIYNYFKDGITQ